MFCTQCVIPSAVSWGSSSLNGMESRRWWSILPEYLELLQILITSLKRHIIPCLFALCISNQLPITLLKNDQVTVEDVLFLHRMYKPPKYSLIKTTWAQNNVGIFSYQTSRGVSFCLFVFCCRHACFGAPSLMKLLHVCIIDLQHCWLWLLFLSSLCG